MCFDVLKNKTGYWVLLITVCLSSCTNMSWKDEEKEEMPAENPIARVANNYLYRKDVAGLIAQRTSPEDSANVVNRYVDSWVKKQLMLKKASEEVELDQAEIERRVQDYRYQLVVYAYEKKFIEENLDTSITQSQINKYYDENLDNFELKNNIVKGVFIRVPKDAPKTNELKGWMLRYDEESQEKLKSYAYSFADNFYFTDSSWIDFDDLIFDTPWVEGLSNKVNALKSSKYFQTADSAHYFFLKIHEYKIADEISPLEFVQERVKDILINKRKIELRKKHEENVFENAIPNRDFEIFED